MQPKHGMSALLIVLLFSLNGFSQVRISGFVADSISGERLIGANVTQKGTTIGYTTDHNGYFSFVADVTAKFKVSYTGYSSVDFVACLHKDSLFQINLSPGKTLSAVTVRAPVHTRPNVTRLGIAELTAIPSLSGKPDVIKAMQMLPGIKTQSEGSSLLLVRGGNPGESLYLLDKTPLIYVNHLGGFMSVFNPDIINSIEIFKAGFPARYGGKLSSVLDITQKEGSAAGARAAYSIGITDVSLLLEGPINNKLTYIFSGRKTLFDLLMMAGTRLSNANRFIMGYGFHDLNGKLSWKPDAHNSLHLNIYQGDDYLNYWSRKDKLNPENKNKKTSVWGNWLVAANWKHVISPRLFSEQIISYTRYRLTERQKFIYKSVSGLYHNTDEYSSSLHDVSLHSNWKYQPFKPWAMDFGLKSALMYHLPEYTFNSAYTVANSSKKWVNTTENALYCDNTVDLGRRFTLEAGLRFVYFISDGFTAINPEPRLTLKKELPKNQQLSLSFMRANQYSHLLFTSGSIMGNEIWIPSDKTIKPSRSDQYSASWNGSFMDGAFAAEFNLYYKTLSNLATYKEGYISLRGGNWQSKVESGGTGESYGLEFLLRKLTGTWTGFISYGWSKTTRQFPTINQGRVFLFDYDRPHSASLFVQHEFSKKVSLSLAWLYQTGLP